jgi:peptide/nickel transport system substrate-binding protein
VLRDADNLLTPSIGLVKRPPAWRRCTQPAAKAPIAAAQQVRLLRGTSMTRNAGDRSTFNASDLASPPAFSRRQVLAGAGSVGMAVALAACGDGGGTTNTDTAGGAVGEPTRGGEFRLGITGGGAKDIMDAQNMTTKPDQARMVSAFETLLVFDENYQLKTDGLAESVTADKPLQYTVRLRKGIEFQNGKTLTADDVIYSLQRIGTRSNGLAGYSAISSLDVANMKKVDQYTVALPLHSPDSTIPLTLANYIFGIVPVGYEAFKGDPSTQIGTGAYELKSFTPGSESTHERNPNYWRSGQPYFDSLRIIDFDDATAQVNALVGGDIDAMTDLPAAQVTSVQSQGLKALISKTGGWQPICMAIDMPPFDNPDVRLAMRLIVDRQGMIDQVVSGYGFIGNDLYAPFDSGYASDLPQRERDIDQAKSLLSKAGLAGASIDLHTTNGAAGMVDVANVFATQAKDAGISINVKNDPNYYGDDYLKLAFSIDFWGTRGYLNQVQAGSLPTSPYNETHWPPKSGTGSDFQSLYQQALAETDESARNEITHQMQQYEFDLGGYIIPYFGNLLDGYAANVQGLQPSKGTLNLDSFGHGFRTIWFS